MNRVEYLYLTPFIKKYKELLKNNNLKVYRVNMTHQHPIRIKHKTLHLEDIFRIDGSGDIISLKEWVKLYV